MTSLERLRKRAATLEHLPHYGVEITPADATRRGKRIGQAYSITIEGSTAVIIGAHAAWLYLVGAEAGIREATR